jgi:hypothetical protein
LPDRLPITGAEIDLLLQLFGNDLADILGESGGVGTEHESRALSSGINRTAG